MAARLGGLSRFFESRFQRTEEASSSSSSSYLPSKKTLEVWPPPGEKELEEQEVEGEGRRATHPGSTKVFLLLACLAAIPLFLYLSGSTWGFLARREIEV